MGDSQNTVVIADFTEADDMLVGFELAGASRCLTAEVLSAAERIDGGNLAERVQARLAEIYVDTLSQLRPRVIVHGNPQHLSNAQVVAQIRALLLAAVRAAVLWRQVGGSQLRLIVRRRQYAMLARGLLARSTLDHG